MTSTPPNPATAADTLWNNLIDWQPATATALLIKLRELPVDWPLRVFGVGRVDAALALPPGAEGEVYDDQVPEIAPYATALWWDDCPACGERGANCRYHDGYGAGRDGLHKPLMEALKADETVTVKAFLASLEDDEVDG
ncbi:hypothetical protein ACKI14_02400 [Streptomyces turgidiscabies]|uniref:hypothetical protein n=1 Tax=Streptomyces turgidiscabies TaxID=85558 RepID=UPI0038F61C5E